MTALTEIDAPFYRLDRSLVYVSRVPAKISNGAVVSIPAVAPVALAPGLAQLAGSAGIPRRNSSRGPQARAASAVFTAWATELQPDISYQTGELIRLASEHDQFGSHRRSALWDAPFALAAPRSGYEVIDPRRSGTWLRDNIDSIAPGYRLSVDRNDAARPRWKVSFA
jgi:hypothetical protein